MIASVNNDTETNNNDNVDSVAVNGSFKINNLTTTTTELIDLSVENDEAQAGDNEDNIRMGSSTSNFTANDNQKF